MIWSPNIGAWCASSSATKVVPTTAPSSPTTAQHIDLSAYSFSSQCPICLGELRDETRAVLPSCGHDFCLPCIKQWSSTLLSAQQQSGSRLCPLCKASFSRILFDIRGDTASSCLQLPSSKRECESTSAASALSGATPRSWREVVDEERRRRRAQSASQMASRQSLSHPPSTHAPPVLRPRATHRPKTPRCSWRRFW